MRTSSARRVVLYGLIVVALISASASPNVTPTVLAHTAPVRDTSDPSTAPEAVGDFALSFTGDKPCTPQPCFDFSGAITVANSSALSPAQLTIEAWVKRSTTSRNETLIGRGDSRTRYWLGFSSTGKLSFSPNGTNNALVDGVTTVSSDKWTHVAVTYGGGVRRYYINGALDLEQSGGPSLVGGSSPLSIAADVIFDFNANYFSGIIDNVRLWNVVRTQDELRAAMFQEMSAATPGLVAEWRLNGNVTDTTGAHNGTIIGGGATFTNEGALPHDIRVPLLSGTMTLDGLCTESTYTNATQVTVDGAAAELFHDANSLWICFPNLPTTNVSTQVFIDRNYDRHDPIQPDDIGMSINVSNTRTTYVGTGTGTYVSTTTLTTTWNAAFIVSGPVEFPVGSTEYRIDKSLFSNDVIGLELRKTTTLINLPVSRRWPALASDTLPSTWSSAILGATGPRRTFNGQVAYAMKGNASTLLGIGGVKLLVIGSDPGGSEAITAMGETTSPYGTYSLVTNDDYTQHRIELDTSSLPRGLIPDSASVPSPAIVLSPLAIDYGDVGGGTYGGAVFKFVDPQPVTTDNSSSPVFTIFAPQSVIDAGALTDFVAYKLRSGFFVEVVALEDLGQPLGSNELRAAIRSAEQQRRTTYGARFKYVLLVGGNGEIPFAQFTMWFDGSKNNQNKPKCLGGTSSADANAEGVKVKFSDWYYVDLTSNFDSNGNGCLLDGVKTASTDLKPGYQPDAAPAFHTHVAVGRIPFADPTAVKTALSNSMGFEKQSDSFKLNVVYGLSNWFLQGRHWTGSQYVNCPNDDANKNCTGGTADGAYLGARLRSDLLNNDGYFGGEYYEDAKPPDAYPLTPNALTATDLKNRLNATQQGAVILGGHGSASGVYRTHWNDANSNGYVESPNSNGVDEIPSGDELLWRTSLSSLYSKDWRGSIFMIGACDTGDPTASDNFARTLMRDGHGIAWVGGLSVVTVGGWTSPNNILMPTVLYNVGDRLLHRDLRLGDAVWQALAYMTQTYPSGSPDMTTDLFGDPTLSYWGNPGGESTLAAWPMLRQNPLGGGRTSLIGPDDPQPLWTYNRSGGAVDQLSPLVSSNGEVIVANGSTIDVLRGGTLFDQVTLDNNTSLAPALAADGTIYALDDSGKLYAFAYHQAGEHEVNTYHRTRRWSLALGLCPTTAPIIGSDGFIAVAHGCSNSTVSMVRPDGTLFAEIDLAGRAQGALAIGVDRKVYAVTSAGFLYKLDFFNGLVDSFTKQPLPTQDVEWATTSNQPHSAPPLLAYGNLYTFADNGDSALHSPTTLTHTLGLKLDSKPTLGPIASHESIIVGTEGGWLYSLNEDLTLRWKKHYNTLEAWQGMPAVSADSIYVYAHTAGGSGLHALNPFTGAQRWYQAVPGAASNGTIAVGYGRELYLTSGDLYAFNDGWAKKPLIIAINAGSIAGAAKFIGLQFALNLSGTLMLDTPQATPTGILLQRSEGGGPWIDLAILPTATTIYTDTTVLPNTPYQYRLKTLDANGADSDYETAETLITSLPNAPAAPVLDTASALSSQAISLTWHIAAMEVVTSYQVLRATNSGGPYNPIGQTGPDVTRFDDSGLASNTTYYYRINAMNQSGTSANSNTRNATTKQQSLPAPQNAVATAISNTQILVTWSGGSAGMDAVIEARQGGQIDFAPLTVVSSTASFTWYTGEPDTYRFRLKFVQSDNESPYAQTNEVDIIAYKLVYLPLVLK